MERKTQLDALAMGLMLVLCASWGAQQVVIKSIYADISPLMQAGVRSAISTLCLLAWAALRRIPLFERDGTFSAGIAAGLLFAIEFALIYWGLTFTSASRSVIFLYTAPFIVAVGAHFWLGERLGSAQIAGLVAAFIGIIVAFGDSLSVPSGREFIGDMMILLASGFWAATTLLIRRSTLARASAEKTLLYQLGVSAVLLPPASMLIGEPGIVRLSAEAMLALTFQGVWVAFASYLTWFWLIARYPATRLSAFTFFTPLFGSMAGLFVLGEKVTLALIIALALVAGGIVLVNRKPRAA